MKTQIQSLALIALVMAAARLPAQTNTTQPTGKQQPHFVPSKLDEELGFVQDATNHPAVNPFDVLDTTNSVNGNTIEKTRAKAEKGDAIAQFNLAVSYSNGEGVVTNLVEAANWYRKAADQGVAEAQFSLGNNYMKGVGVTQDTVEAVKWFRKAAEKNYPDAQNNLGVCYFNGTGIAKDETEAVKWYRKSAEQNYALAQFKLGWCYANGQGVAKDYVEAVKWYLKAAEQNYTPAQSNLGACYANGQGVAKDYVEAVKWYRKSAEQNYALAQFNLGVCYEYGEGVATNMVEAAMWYRKAAEQGQVDAQYQLGLMYFRGMTLAQRGDGSLTLDDTDAEKWFLKAAQQGNVDAQAHLGLIKLLFKQDYAEAEKWLRKAADKDNAGAEYLLGTMYSEGWGMEKDYVEAAKWIQRCAEQGHGEAQTDIGVMYFEGQGVEKDYAEAYAWWNLAAKSSTDAARKRAILEERMTPAQIAEAQKRTKELRVLVEARSKKEQSQTDPFSIAQARKSDPTATGTGFFITDDGYLISNYHVVKDATQIRLLTSVGLISARLVSVDAANDLALLKAEGKFSSLPIAASRSASLGSTVATIGFPDIGLQGFSPKLAKGEIASLSGAADDPRYFQISVPVQPGNSGGALVDERGNVVGIVSAKLNASAALAASGQLPENVNYAVKSSLLLSFLESVPDASAKLKVPNTSGEQFSDVVKSAQQAAVLVLVY